LAYHATRRDLLRRADALAPVLARCGITLRRDVLEDASRDVWRGVGLAAPSPRRRASGVTDRLRGVLDRVEGLTAQR
jgi:hypothetical protein